MKNPQGVKRRGRPRGFDVDEAAAAAALLFWRYGYEGVSVDELTAAMGITTQSFYAAFGSKRKLYDAALVWYEGRIAQPLRDAMADEADVVVAIRMAMELAAEAFTRPDTPLGCMRSTAGFGASRENEAIAQHGASLRAETTAFFEARLNQAVRDGQIEEALDVRATALYLNAMLVGMSVAARDGVDLHTLLVVARLAASAVSKSECGIRTPAPLRVPAS